MDSQGGIESGEVEWLNLGPRDRPVGTDPPGRHQRWWYALAAGVIVAAVLVVSLRHDAEHTTASPSHPPTTATAPATAPSVAQPSPSAPSPSAPSVVVTNTGHRLLDVPADWELVGRGADVVVRIQLARGRITRTAVPALDSGGGTSLVAGPDRVIIRPWDRVPGYEVPNGRPVRELPASLGQHGPALPGPDPDHLWVPSDTDRHMTLVGFDGRPAGVSLPIPDGTGAVSSDEAGYLLFYGTGGVYDVRPDGIRRITTGVLLAAGPTRWLTLECDDQYRCATTVTDRASGARRVIDTPAGGYGDAGVIAPDGSAAALLRLDGGGQPTVRLLDLTTGANRATGVSFDAENGFGTGPCVWSPDSRWLFVAGVNGRVEVLDRHTMRVADLGVNLPPVSQLAFRSGSR